MTKVQGKVEAEDYEKLNPLLENLLKQYSKVKWYYEMEDFKGWELGGLGEELKLDVKNAMNFEKIAMVGDKDWQKWIAKLMKPFTSADVKYFEHSNKEEAKRWIRE